MSQLNRWCLTSMSLMHSLMAISFRFSDNSASGLSINENWARILSSHLICTQPGLRMKDQGWYHFSMSSRLEHRVSSHRWRICSLRPRHISVLNLTSKLTFSWLERISIWKIILLYVCMYIHTFYKKMLYCYLILISCIDLNSSSSGVNTFPSSSSLNVLHRTRRE